MSDAREAWRAYASVGAIKPDLLRPHVAAAWERVHAAGVSPWRHRAEVLERLELVSLLEGESSFITAARPYMDALSRAAGAERHASMLADARGVVIDVVGDEASVRGPESVPGPGALLAEACCGSNGLGTPLAVGGYSELVGAEHFIEGFHAHTCQGITIRDADGRIRGALSLSVRRLEAAERLRDVLVCAAHGVQAELLRARLQEDVRRVLADPGAGDVPLATLREDIVQAQATARLQIETASLAAGQSRLEYALRLIALAETALERFQRRAELWRALSTPELGGPSQLDLAALVRDMVDILQTEAAMHGVALAAADSEPCPLVADRRALGRSLLRFFVKALEAAGSSGTLQVETVRWAAGRQAEVRARLLGDTHPVQLRTFVVPLADTEAGHGA